MFFHFVASAAVNNAEHRFVLLLEFMLVLINDREADFGIVYFLMADIVVLVICYAWTECFSCLEVKKLKVLQTKGNLGRNSFIILQTPNFRYNEIIFVLIA